MTPSTSFSRRIPTGDARRHQQGFTLIEIMVVIIILGLLGAVVGPRLLGNVGKANTDTTRLQIENLSAALDLYYLEVGDYPSTEQGLDALIMAPQDVPGWNGPYLKKRKVPTDAWKRPFIYRAPGEQGAYDLYSLGKDGTEGGEGENTDIVSWE